MSTTALIWKIQGSLKFQNILKKVIKIIFSTIWDSEFSYCPHRNHKQYVEARSFIEKLNIKDDQPENFVKSYSSFKRRWSSLILNIDIFILKLG